MLVYYREELDTDAGFYAAEAGANEGRGAGPLSAEELLPPPFKGRGRPRLGTRLLVKNNFPRMSPGCLSELQAWQTQLRPRAAALLLAMLVFQEGMVAPQLPAVLPALWCSIDDQDDATVRARVSLGAQLVGRLAPPESWLPQVAERLEDPELSSAQRASAARLVAALLVRCAPPCPREPEDANQGDGRGDKAKPTVIDGAGLARAFI